MIRGVGSSSPIVLSETTAIISHIGTALYNLQSSFTYVMVFAFLMFLGPPLRGSRVCVMITRYQWGKVQLSSDGLAVVRSHGGWSPKI